MCVARPHVMHMQAELIWPQNTANWPGDKWMFGVSLTTGKVPLSWSSICFTFCLRLTLISSDLRSICTFLLFKVPRVCKEAQKYQSVPSKLPHLLELLYLLGLLGRCEERLHTSHGANAIWAALLLCMVGATRLDLLSLPQRTMICL